METNPLNEQTNKLTNWAIFPQLTSVSHAYWFRYITEDKEDTT